MNNKSALAISFLIFSFSLSALADDVDDVVVTGQQVAQYSTSAQQQTPIEIPESSGNNQYSSKGYADAKAQEAAAAEKGKKLQACYTKLAALDKSKFACSEDGELIDVVQVTGVKDTGTSGAPSLVNEAYYKEMDNTRPAAPVIPKPESCSASSIALKRSECESTAKLNFGNRNDNCIIAGGVVFATSVAAGTYISLSLRDPNVVSTKRELIVTGGLGGIAGAYIGEIVGNMVRDGCSSHYNGVKEGELAQCDLDEKRKIEECSKL